MSKRLFVSIGPVLWLCILEAVVGATWWLGPWPRLIVWACAMVLLTRWPPGWGKWPLPDKDRWPTSLRRIYRRAPPQCSAMPEKWYAYLNTAILTCAVAGVLNWLSDTQLRGTAVGIVTGEVLSIAITIFLYLATTGIVRWRRHDTSVHLMSNDTGKRASVPDRTPPTARAWTARSAAGYLLCFGAVFAVRALLAYGICRGLIVGLRPWPHVPETLASWAWTVSLLMLVSGGYGPRLTQLGPSWRQWGTREPWLRRASVDTAWMPLDAISVAVLFAGIRYAVPGLAVLALGAIAGAVLGILGRRIPDTSCRGGPASPQFAFKVGAIGWICVALVGMALLLVASAVCRSPALYVPLYFAVALAGEMLGSSIRSSRRPDS